MRSFLLMMAAPALFAQAAQTPTPVYARESIVPFHGNQAKLLAPSMVVELYGQHLAPEPWCGAAAMPPAPYPVDVCGVRVMVGTKPAGLMSVGPTQVNFKIPEDAPSEGSAPIQVCVGNVCGPAVVMQFSTHTAYLRLRGTASVHMPVWVEIDEPAPYEVKYPCAGVPWSFEGYRFEVRRNGQPLTPAPEKPQHLSAGSGGGCVSGATPSALPLHLLYDFDQPGVYSVRFTATQTDGPSRGTTICQSDWTDITVAPYSSAKRDDWLRSVADRMKSARPETLIGEIIPSLLAWPDEKALQALLPLLALPNPAGSPGQFARFGLAAFSDELLRRVIPPDALLRYCPPDGRCRGAN